MHAAPQFEQRKQDFEAKQKTSRDKQRIKKNNQQARTSSTVRYCCIQNTSFARALKLHELPCINKNFGTITYS